MPDYLGKSHNGQFLGTVPGLTSGGNHPGARNTHELGRRDSLPQSFNQSCSEGIAGGFAGRNSNSERR